MPSTFSKIKCLEWCTYMPLFDVPRTTPPFSLNGNMWSFRFACINIDGGSMVYSLYMELESENTKFISCHGQFQVSIKGQTSILCKRTIEISEPCSKGIWYISKRDLQSKLPSDYTITFLFIFGDLSESVLKISEKVDDKCLQTNSCFSTGGTLESLSKDFSRLFESGPSHDAEIKCGEHSIKAHKIILSARSEVFKAMLESNMLEGQTGIVQIKDIDVNYVHDFVRYLYTGEMPELNFAKAKVFYEAGDKYAIRSLMLRSSEFLQDNLSPENVFDCFVLAEAHSDDKLKDKIKTYILEEKIYLKNKHWLPFCESFPKIANEIYRLSYENITEE